MKKLHKVYRDIQDEEKFIRRNSLTVNDFHEFMRICNTLSKGESDTTINAQVKALCEKYGFGVFVEGVGWRIKLNRQPKRIIDQVLKAVYGDTLTEGN